MSNRTICTYIHNSEDELKKRISCVEMLQEAIRDTNYKLSSCAKSLQRTFVEHVKLGIIPTIDFLTVTVTDVDDEYNWFNGLSEERILEAIADVIEWGIELELLDDDAYVADDSELKEMNDMLRYFASKLRTSYSSEVSYRKYARQEVIRRVEAYRLMKDNADLIVRTVVANPKHLPALDLDLKVVGIAANGQDKVDVSYVWHKEDEMEHSDNVETLTIDAYLLDISEVRLFIYEVQKFAERYWEERNE